MVIPRVPGEVPRDLGRAPEEVRLRIYPEIAGLRLDRALHKLLSWRSRSWLQRLIRQGLVARIAAPGDDPSRTVNPARASMRMRSEEILVVQIPPREGPAAVLDWSADQELAAVYEDEWLLAIDKPAGLTVHPSGRRLDGTLVNMLHRRYRNLDQPELDVVPRLCHRLDRETSGVILVAKSAMAHSAVRKQFEAMAVQKSYLAIVEGRVAQKSGVIDLPLGPDSRSSIRLKTMPRSDGLAACTHWELRARHGELSLLECFPQTGRQHQIRVHLAAIGHPVVGDKLYGPDERYFIANLEGELDELARRELRLERHALHSHTLKLRHPMRDEALEIEAALPAELAALLRASSR